MHHAVLQKEEEPQAGACALPGASFVQDEGFGFIVLVERWAFVLRQEPSQVERDNGVLRVDTTNMELDYKEYVVKEIYCISRSSTRPASITTTNFYSICLTGVQAMHSGTQLIGFHSLFPCDIEMGVFDSIV